MKNVQFILAFLCLSWATAHTQTGKFNLSAGVGFDPTTKMDNATINTVPLTFKLGYQLTPLFSLNAFGGYTSTTSAPHIVNDGLAIQTTNEQSFIGLRGEVKKSFSERFEMYGGASLGYMHRNLTDKTTAGREYVQDQNSPSHNDPNAANGQLYYAGFFGSTFFIQKHIGVFAEVGYGVSLLNGGVTVRF